MPPLQSTVRAFNGAIVIPNNSPLEYLLAFILIFLVGAVWGHLRCSNPYTRREEHAAC